MVYADISNMSTIKDEEETLFDIGTTFIVNSVSFHETENNWVIQLVGSDQGRDIVSEKYIDFYRERMSTLSPTVKLAEFLIIVGQYDKARLYLENILKLRDQDEVHIIYDLAWIDKLQGKYADAREKLQHAYAKETSNNTTSHAKLRNILIDIGIIHQIMGEYKQAISFNQQAAEIASSPELLNNMGLVYQGLEQYDVALKYFNQAVDLYKEKFPDGHYSLAVTLNNIGQTYNYQRKYDEAFEYHSQALLVNQQTLPNDHMNIGISLNNLGFTYQQLKKYENALQFYQRALQLYEKSLPPVHEELVVLFDNMANLYYCRNHFIKSIEYRRRAISIQERMKPLNYSSMGRLLSNLGVTLAAHKLNNEQNDKEAFNCFRQAFEMYTANNLDQTTYACISLYQQAKLHDRRQEYYEAFPLYVKVLKTLQSIPSMNSLMIINITTALSLVKVKIETNKRKIIFRRRTVSF